MIAIRALPCTLHAPQSPAASRLPARKPHRTYALFAIRQNANSLSAANKLLIRCTWVGTSAFASAGYDSGWGPGTCPATFTTKAALRTAVQAFNANPTAAIAMYGPIAYWDVSAVTNMKQLFDDMRNFNADISNWDTSGVTSMHRMFRVHSPRLPYTQPPVGPTPCTLLAPHPHNHEHRARALLPICSRALPRTLLAPRSPAPPPACRPVYLAPHGRLPTRIPRPAPYALLSTLGRTRVRSTNR
eukprot:scaffold107693_cov56-Phaeocystis_antarctica.AAC.2